ncbi:hypothetical protein DSM3645_29931 [Blastopirellula marina DSM 3645]|uniref:Novel STAND NTPase 5 domain-containing protein n=1 Tax=Blastopirellula marina DSM 3645 TaxID=314230 RepID=A3ZXL1_9BACT|nr:hypothetical protein DSM3645_29931 [Blastopirellula marina DSM 3645]
MNWGLIQDGGVLESLMHAILYAENPQTILFGRPGKDAGQDARTADGKIVYQSKYRDGMDMSEAIKVALKELEFITKYREKDHANYQHWEHAERWVLFANLSINPNDDAKWKSEVVPKFAAFGLNAEYWCKSEIEGKLAEKPEVRDVFFEHENRVLVGLKEAHDLIASERIGNDSLDDPMLGRDAELAEVKAFADSNEKRILPVIGPGGIGKSRFLYESLVALSQDGWRVLWGLSGVMAESTQWFRLLNGNQKTCVALDDPEDPRILRAIVEQLSTVERRNWRVIVSCRTDRSGMLRRYQTNSSLDKTIRLSALNESDSKSLINTRLGRQADDAWGHGAFRLTKGVPGWLSLLSELVKQGRLADFPVEVDGVASSYLAACLESVGDRERALTVLRWLSLWGSVVFDGNENQRDEIELLTQEGIPKSDLGDLLKKLVDTGLVRNWGIGKRLYGVESMLVRQSILSEWLLNETSDGKYSVGAAGKALVSELLSGRVPRIDDIFQTIASLSFSRLDSEDAFTLLQPIFDELAGVATSANLVGQNHIAELVAKLGVADPENALDVLIAIREHLKDVQEIADSFWGNFTFTRNKVLSTLSWTLFNLADRVDDAVVASRFLGEFRELAKLAETGMEPSDPGKSPSQLLHRLLCESRNSEVFAKPAFEMANEKLFQEGSWPFVGRLAKCILEPMRERNEWVGNWTLGVARFALVTGSSDWERLLDLRAKLFEALKLGHHESLHESIWSLLSDSHHSINYALAHYRIIAQDAQNYRDVLREDLTKSKELLEKPLSFGEATRARPMWAWYLDHGKDEVSVALARECEKIYSGLSEWQIHDFFRFDYDERLAFETKRIAGKLLAAADESEVTGFFDEVDRYLRNARGDSEDLADGMQLVALAELLADQFSLDAQNDTSALSSFVRSVLAAGNEAKPREFRFVVSMCRKRLKDLKANGDVDGEKWLTELLAISQSKEKVLYQLYQNAHPDSIGPLTAGEVRCILARKESFMPHERAWLLGVIVGAFDETVASEVFSFLESSEFSLFETSNFLGLFIRSARLAFLRFDRSPTQKLCHSVLEWIISLKLNGGLLGFYDLKAMFESSEYVPDMRTFASLMRSRVELESISTRRDQIEVLPYGFDAKAWCQLDPSSSSDVSAFDDVCRLALGDSFTATYWIPGVLSEIDADGVLVAAFVARYLDESEEPDNLKGLSKLANLASKYAVNSEAWAGIARSVCERARSLPRKDREHLYFCLSSKETGVMTSMPGEVPQYYIEACEEAKRLLEQEPVSSPLLEYRRWALNSAERDLRFEQGRAEEDADG